MAEFASLNGYYVKDQQSRKQIENTNQEMKNKANKVIQDFLLKKDDYLIRVNTQDGIPNRHFMQYSNDGIKWNKIADIPDSAFMNESSWKSSYDVCCVFHNGYFYMTYDYINTSLESWNQITTEHPNFFKGGNKIGVTRTKDFINFEKYSIDIDTTYIQQWAPDFYIDDDGKCYIVVSLCNGELNNSKGFFFRPYIIELDSDIKNVVKDPTLILDVDYSTIDPCIYKENGIYYLFNKNDNELIVEQFKSDNLLSFSNKINSISWNYVNGKKTQIEGPSIVKYKNIYYLYCDTYNHINIVFNTDNIENWYNCNWCETDFMMGHSTVCKVDDDNKKSLMKKYFDNFDYPSENKYHRSRTYLEIISYPDKIKFDKFYVLPNRTYIAYWNGGTNQITIDRTLYNIVSNSAYDEVYFENQTGQKNGLCLKSINGNTDFYLPLNTKIAVIGNKAYQIRDNVHYTGLIELTNISIQANVPFSYVIEIPGINFNRIKSANITGFRNGKINRFIDYYITKIEDGKVTIGITSSEDMVNISFYYDFLC